MFVFFCCGKSLVYRAQLILELDESPLGSVLTFNVNRNVISSVNFGAGFDLSLVTT